MDFEIDSLSDLDVGSTSKRQLKLVDVGVKPSATIGSRNKIDDILKKRGLYFQRTDPDAEHYKKYPNDLPLYTYDITRNKRLNQRFKRINQESVEDTKPTPIQGSGLGSFGRMYGYPSCCSKRYEKDFEHGINPGQRYAEQLGGRAPPPELRHVEHIPCSPNCARSKALGRRYAKALGEEIQARRGFHGIVRQPTRFLVGEAGPERVNVTPLRNNHIQHIRMNNFNINIGIKGMRQTPSVFGKGSLNKLARF